MLIAGWLMLPGEGRSVCLARGHVRIKSGRITEVSREAPIFPPELGGDSTIICPGFIDAHVHLPQFDSIGAEGLTLLDWLDRVIYPAEAAWADADHAGTMAECVANQLLSYGTTGIAAYATVHHEAACNAMRALADVGIRGVVGQVLMDRGAPDELIRPAEQLLREAAALPSPERIQPCITPRFALTCTSKLLDGAGELASKAGWPVQTHLAETREECRKAGELFDGLKYTEIYRRAGLLTARTLLAHGIWLDDDELAAIAEAESVIAHCPTANTFLRSGEMRRARANASGTSPALGSDVAGGPDRSMVRVARAMLETAARAAGDDSGAIPTASEAWWQITAGNADALGWADGGRIEPGAEADLVLLEPDIDLGHDPDAEAENRQNPALARLLYAWDDRWVRRTLLRGDVAYSAPGV